jgi:SAM-dependent methyltransferase
VSSPDAIRERLLGALTQPVADLAPFAPSGRLWRATRPYRAARNRLVGSIFERGLETERFELELEHFRRDSVTYQPSHWGWLRKVLRAVQVDPHDVFVDFGSGKGRIVFQAARYPFARVVGVEISERLSQIARSNIERNRGRLRARRVDLVTADAAAFAVPDDMTYAYFYYPFAGETFRTVVANIVDSIDRNPRRVTLVYACPRLEDAILATGRFALRRTLKSRLWPDAVGLQVAVYVSEPAAESPAG